MTEGVARDAVTWQTLVGPGVEAVRRSWRPLVLLQLVALMLVIAYSQSAAVREACVHLAAIKTQWGLWFSAAATALAGGLLPEIAKVLALGQRRFDRGRWNDMLFVLWGFALAGTITDFQYRLMAWLYGTGTDWATVAIKVLTDQFVATPIYGAPFWIVLYAWRHNGYSILRARRELSGGWYLRRVVPLLVPCWFFWIPMAGLVYALPGPLQMWLFLFAVAGWSLLMACVAGGQKDRSAAATGASVAVGDGAGMVV